MIPEEAKTSFLELMMTTYINTHELEEVTSYTIHVFHERDMKIMLTKVSNTSLMFNMNHGVDRMLQMGSTATHWNFHNWNSAIM